MPNVSQLLTECEQICRTVAPRDLADLPLYILPQSALPPELNSVATCDGYTSVNLDVHYREIIGDAWQGRGPCMVINDTHLLDLLADEPETPMFIHSLAVHELAHILIHNDPYDEALADRPPDEIRAEAIRHNEQSVAFWQGQIESGKFGVHHRDSHGDKFIRTGLHLWHRGRKAGHRLMLGIVIGTREHFPTCYRYPEALGDEVEIFADWKLADILSTPAPDAFLEMWNEDKQAWIEAQVA